MGNSKHGSVLVTAVLAGATFFGGASASATPINIYLDETRVDWHYTTNPGGLSVIENFGLLVLCESGLALSHPGCDSHGLSDIIVFSETLHEVQDYYLLSENSDVDSSTFLGDTGWQNPSISTLQDVLDYWTGVGAPTVFFVEFGTESGWNGLDYSPLSNQPGYFSFNGNTPTYHITSDPAPVPAPATLGLFGVALAFFGFLRWRKVA